MRALFAAAAFMAAMAAAPAYASEGDGHADPVASVALWLVVILLAAKFGGDLAVRIGDEATFSALVVMIIVTTVVTPPALKWSLGRLGPRT